MIVFITRRRPRRARRSPPGRDHGALAGTLPDCLGLDHVRILGGRSVGADEIDLGRVDRGRFQRQRDGRDPVDVAGSGRRRSSLAAT